ncbi:hypothetical protein [Microvirga sp. VF16]|uniref:hypothetical protein n=1 Tax=Microvirga sp. VF16 TaxID=2807101 RepID=UPI00193CE080|nr:hypothetical protein [Microvirga sp. VF16]QRM35123.1 hypothetical protein JO965_39690 [Microvirga sp. VF16]
MSGLLGRLFFGGALGLGLRQSPAEPGAGLVRRRPQRDEEGHGSSGALDGDRAGQPGPPYDGSSGEPLEIGDAERLCHTPPLRALRISVWSRRRFRRNVRARNAPLALRSRIRSDGRKRAGGSVINPR